MNRAIVGLSLALLIVVAGCSGPGDRTPQPLEGTASAATVGDDGLSAAGYEKVAVRSEPVNRNGTLDVSGDVELTVNYRVRATAQRAEYRQTDGARPAVFALYSAPQVSPDSVDVAIDPLGDRSTVAIVERAQGTYGDLGTLEHVENSTVTLLGVETTLVTYATTAAAEGERVEVRVHVATVEHDGDVVRAVAVTPRDADDAETLRTLLSAVEHG